MYRYQNRSTRQYWFILKNTRIIITGPVPFKVCVLYKQPATKIVVTCLTCLFLFVFCFFVCSFFAGNREYQEDRYSVMENIVCHTHKHQQTQSHTTSLRMYGLYDGHGGDEVSTLLCERMLPLISAEFQEHDVQEKEEQEENRRVMFQLIFQQMDKDILNIQMSTISSTHLERLSPSSHTSRHTIQHVRTYERAAISIRPVKFCVAHSACLDIDMQGWARTFHHRSGDIARCFSVHTFP